MAKSRKQQPKQADLPLPARAYIDMALAFANQQDSTSVQEAEALAWRPFGLTYRLEGGADQDRLDRVQHARSHVRVALRQLETGGQLKPRIRSEIRALIRGLTAHVDFDKRGLRYVYDSHDVTTCAALGVALLAESELLVRLRSCDYNECEQGYFLAEGRRTAAKYCSPEHAEKGRKLAGAARQERWRNKQRKRGK